MIEVSGPGIIPISLPEVVAVFPARIELARFMTARLRIARPRFAELPVKVLSLTVNSPCVVA